MTTSRLAELEDLADFLAAAGYDVRVRALGRFSRVLLAENPYALIACVDVETWSGLDAIASDLQSELTHLTRNAYASSKRWDLYVVLHVRADALKPVVGPLIEQIEGDTKFARKFVRVNLLPDAATLDRALRPFLPLRGPMPVSLADPLDVLRRELIAHGLDGRVVDAALGAFAATGEVRLP